MPSSGDIYALDPRRPRSLGIVLVTWHPFATNGCVLCLLTGVDERTPHRKGGPIGNTATDVTITKATTPGVI